MKKALLLFATFLALWQTSFAYNFYAVAPSGQTLYYNIVNGNAEVTYKNNFSPSYTSLFGSLTIPATVSYYGTTYSVTGIGNDAFYGCSGLTSVTIPNSVTGIGRYAFRDCSGLTGTLTIPDSVTSIGNCAFYGCSGLTSVMVASGNSTYDSRNNCNAIIHTQSNELIVGCNNTVIPNSVTSIGPGAFYGCSGLTGALTIPNSVTSIGDAAFALCTSIDTVFFNATNCTSAGNSVNNSVFAGCSNISSVIIGSNVQRIPNYLFYGCGGLTSLDVPDGASSIGENSFMDCDHLTNITLGSGLRNIGNEAFSGCTQVVRIKSRAAVAPTVYSNTFEGLRDSIIVNTPCGSATSYENTAYWIRFNIQEELMYNFSATTSNPARGTVTIVTAPTCDNREAQVLATPYHGYEFDHWSDGNTDNPRYIVVLQDTSIVAYFRGENDPTGIREAEEGDNGFRVFADGRQIVVEGTDDMPVMLYDATGRLLATRRNEDVHGGTPLRLDVPVSGTYLIKVGNYPARKVVVVR